MQQKLVCCVALSFVFLVSASAFGIDEPVFRLQINVNEQSGPALKTRLDSLGLDSVYLNEPQLIELFASQKDLQLLNANRIHYNIAEKARPLVEKLAEEALPSGYRDLATINAVLLETQNKYPAIAKLVDVGKEYGIGNTYEGRPMYALKISDNVQVDEDEPNVFFVALHHAREIITPEIILDIIRRLTEGYTTDSKIRSYVDNNEIFLAPVWNPDGYEYVWRVNNMWRKNRKPVSSTAFGVDQNRNYDLGWASSCGGSSIPSSETYRGPSANSEEETQNLILFSRKRQFAKVVDFHSYGREVLLSYTCTPIPSIINNYIISEGTALAKIVSYANRVPSADGEHQQFAIKELSNYAFLVETETEFQPSYSRAIAEANRLWPLVQAVFDKTIPLSGRVTDSRTGRPIRAKIDVREVAWRSGETRYSDAVFGRYYEFLPDGTYTFTFSAAGYQPSTVTVSVSNASATIRDIALSPAS